MKFKYVGSGDDSPEITSCLGHGPFTLGGKALEVTGDEAIRLFSGNDSFEAVKPTKAAVKKADEADKDIH